MSAKLFQLFPKPLLTVDQLKLLKYDNIPSKKYQTNSDIGVPAQEFLNKKLKSIVICGEKVGSFQQKNIINIILNRNFQTKDI